MVVNNSTRHIAYLIIKHILDLTNVINLINVIRVYNWEKYYLWVCLTLPILKSEYMG